MTLESRSYALTSAVRWLMPPYLVLTRKSLVAAVTSSVVKFGSALPMAGG